MDDSKPKNILNDVLYGMGGAPDGASKDAPDGASDIAPDGAPEDDPSRDMALDMEKLQGIIHRTLPSKPGLPQEELPDALLAVPVPLQQQLPKKRTTIYLSPATYERLAASKDIVREMLPQDSEIRVSMSAVVDNALQIMLNELDVKRKDSVLLNLMLRNSE